MIIQTGSYGAVSIYVKATHYFCVKLHVSLTLVFYVSQVRANLSSPTKLLVASLHHALKCFLNKYQRINELMIIFSLSISIMQNYRALGGQHTSTENCRVLLLAVNTNRNYKQSF